MRCLRLLLLLLMSVVASVFCLAGDDDGPFKVESIGIDKYEAEKESIEESFGFIKDIKYQDVTSMEMPLYLATFGPPGSKKSTTLEQVYLEKSELSLSWDGDSDEGLKEEGWLRHRIKQDLSDWLGLSEYRGKWVVYGDPDRQALPFMKTYIEPGVDAELFGLAITDWDQSFKNDSVAERLWILNRVRNSNSVSSAEIRKLLKRRYTHSREASNNITPRLLNKAFKNRYPIVHGTTSTSADDKLLDPIKEKGYCRVFVMCLANEETRMGCMENRYEREKIYQVTPEDAEKKAYKTAEQFPVILRHAEEMLLHFTMEETEDVRQPFAKILPNETGGYQLELNRNLVDATKRYNQFIQAFDALAVKSNDQLQQDQMTKTRTWAEVITQYNISLPANL